MENLLNKAIGDSNILKVITVDSSSVLDDEGYKDLKSQACIMGGAFANEIDENGNMVFKVLSTRISDNDIEKFNSQDITTYHYEHKGMSAFLIDGFVKAELIINPSYYDDDRFEKLLSKNSINMYCELIDCSKNKIMAVRNITISGKPLEYLKDGLKMNAQYTREVYSEWVVKVLYSNVFRKNVKLSERLGKCIDSREYIAILE